MAKGNDRKPAENEDEKEDKDAGVSDDALELIDEDEDEVLDLGVEPGDDKGWE